MIRPNGPSVVGKKLKLHGHNDGEFRACQSNGSASGGMATSASRGLVVPSPVPCQGDDESDEQCERADSNETTQAVADHQNMGLED